MSGAPAADGVRYGVFLRPSREITERTHAGYDLCRREFGLTAAAAYPPHVTIVGSIDAAAEEEELLATIDGAVASAPAMDLRVEPLSREPGSTYLGHRITGPDVEGLRTLMSAVLAAVAPLRRFRDGDFDVEQRRHDDAASFRPHLTVLGHDGADHPERLDAALAALRELGLGEGVDMIGDDVVAYRMTSRDWQGRYWETMRWEVARTWHLGR